MRDFDPTAGEFAGHDAIHAFGREHGRRVYDPGSILQGGMGLLGSAMAGDAQEDAAAQSAALSREQFQQVRSDLAPYRRTGAVANNKLASMLGLYDNSNYIKAAQEMRDARPWVTPDWTPDEGAVIEYMRQNGDRFQNTDSEFGSLLKKFTGEDLVNDPGYQFRRDEGQKGVERSAASRGGLFSGAAAKALNKFNQDYASTEFGNAFNRDASSKNQIYSMLSGQQGVGQASAAQTGQAGQNYAGQAGQAIQAGGNAASAGIVGGVNALSGAYDNYNNYNLLNSLTRRGNGGYTSGLYEGAYGG